MTYKELQALIRVVKENDKFQFVYGDKTYTFNCYSEYSNGKKSFSVSGDEYWGRSMNVDKITTQYITLYDYNLMGQRSSFKLPIAQMTLV